MSLNKLVTGIQHIGLPTNSIEKTMAFYKSLGFDVVMETVNEKAQEKVAFLRMGNLIIETYQNGCAVEKAGAIDHVALDVVDIDKAFATVSEGNYDLLDKEIQFLPFWKNGVKFFTIVGPNGEKVEFSQIL